MCHRDNPTWKIERKVKYGAGFQHINLTIWVRTGLTSLHYLIVQRSQFVKISGIKPSTIPQLSQKEAWIICETLNSDE